MDWPEIAKRYPMPEGADPRRPWWCRSRDGWQRKDGRHVAGAGSATGKARVDVTSPLSTPLPAAGQVWVRGERESMAVAVRRHSERVVMVVWGDTGEAWYRLTEGDVPSDIYAPALEDWPPSGAALVYGPGAPWEDTRP